MKAKKLMAMGLLSALVISGMPVNVLSSYAAETDVSQLVQEASTTFTFTESGVNTLSGSEDSYKIEGTDLTIKESGVYIITGNCSEGSVTVKKGTTGVTLILQDLSLACSYSAPICINKENTDTTIVVTGTNTVTDNEDPADEESTDAEVADAFEGAAIKLKDGGDLTITGTGTLNVNGTAKNGIKGGDGSTINIGASYSDSFTLNVTASNDGISGDGAEGVAGLNIIGGNINVSAADDGIKSDYILNIGQSGSSYGATINVTNSTEGLEGATVNLYGGTGYITSSDDGINAANSDLTDYSYSLNIYGGTWYVNAGGDGIDSNGTINVTGGITDISSASSGDNIPIDWGENSSMTVNGGTIIGIGNAGMQQGITNGTYVMFGGGAMGGMPGDMGTMPSDMGTMPSDMGSMPSGMSGMPSGMSGMPSGMSGMPSGMSGMPGGMSGMPSDMSGMPSDMSGMPSGLSGMPSGMSGMPSGMSGMPSDMSGMPSDMNGTQQSNISLNAGDTVSILDESGNTIYTTTVKKSANSVIFASPLLTSGGTYTLSVNGTTVATATTGTNGSNFVPGGAPSFDTNGGNGNNGNTDNGNNGNTDNGNTDNGNTDNSNIDNSQSTTPVYRFYNRTNGDHLYTTSENEKQVLRNNGWNYEGIAFYSSNDNSSTAVYRVYNPYSGDHHFTKDADEYRYLTQIGWHDEGITFYAKTSGENAVYRLFNPYSTNNTHHYTNSLSEYEYLTDIGWVNEGICWYQ